MYFTEQEILDTPTALARTCEYFETRHEPLEAFFKAFPQRKFVFMGCGSSFMLAKSAATLFGLFPNTAATAIPAGDYIVDPDSWKETLRDSIVVTLSRSGRTSELVRAINHIKENLGCPVLSISMENNNYLTPMSNLELTMDWCYDKSICQTRTVANLYAALLLTASVYTGDRSLSDGVSAAHATGREFQAANRPALEKLAALEWDSVVVLADGAVCGLAEEASLAFTEIAMITGHYFHLLDYRHGPIVINGERTLTIMLLRPDEQALQGDMVRDVMSHGGYVITVSDQAGNPFRATAHITISGIENFAAWGIPFLYVAQMLAFLKSIALGGNPDAPKGLDPYITL